jgi:hypothetical protein
VGIGRGEVSGVPSGTRRRVAHVDPALKTPGYYHRSLRDLRPRV